MRKTVGLVVAAAVVGILGGVSDASAKPEQPKVEMMAIRAEHEARTPPRMAAADDARGLYVRGQTAGRADFTTMLDRMHARGIDTVVLDAKDYDGLLTYPSKVALAIEGGAVMKNPPIKDLPAKIREIHAHGLRVAMRVSCFNDGTMSKAKPLLSVRSKGGHAYPIGWMDPANPGAQDYVFSLVKESLDAGADEIELDYIRYPVLGIKNADFHLQERKLTKVGVIRDFVHHVHAMTKARGVPLSLDVFGVIAFGKRTDIDGLGQDPVVLAQECEVLSPMVYPSHYDPGFAGFDSPGDHPELVGMATKKIIEQIDDAKLAHPAKIRPWLQAMAWKSPTYSPGYLVREIHSTRDNGGSGWLMWNPGQNYGYTWQAVPAKRTEQPGTKTTSR
ncbi:MAG: putative glycoside hydrolase [Polyangiaceae bacterium]